MRDGKQSSGHKGKERSKDGGIYMTPTVLASPDIGVIISKQIRVGPIV